MHEMVEDVAIPQVDLELAPHQYVSQSLDVDFREASFFSDKDAKLPSPLELHVRQGQYSLMRRPSL